ncbi:zinc ribbon domain-containing protein [Tengunoibacter tsumagoiensis]|uniref:Zinc-ribbon domain-containing protein n=1 Tax=Tengunoibacter tsumagoiensis TaxID=2014871 RepID=A0A402AA14_9CHLR|nr:zinc ribbon domain-containing protein [Tengunoibacter tsumagoiensis]GCE15938.1 hypothetical protein KTT_57970 [Tengunoibacter tsumagoiensis]
MPLYCQQCSQENLDGTVFCKQCGTRLPVSANNGPQNAFTYSSPNPDAQYSFPPPAGQFRPGQQTGIQQQPAPGLANQHPTASLSLTELGIRRAFAGHGHVIQHQSWLLPGASAQLNETIKTVNLLFSQTGMAPELQQITERLKDQSLITEEREFIRLKRKLPTIFVYATSAGRDLYISRATVVKPAISTLRIIIAALCGLASLPAVFLVFGIFSLLFVGSASTNGNTSSQYGNTSSFTSLAPLFVIPFIFLAIVTNPFFMIILVGIARSIRSWVLEKDFWELLRPNRLSEFQRDDIALLEQVTDDVIRSSLKQLNLDADKIVPPSQGYQAPSQIRRFI